MIAPKDDWRDCWINHKINQRGTVVRVSDHKILPQCITPSGYAFVSLYANEEWADVGDWIVEMYPKAFHVVIAEEFDNMFNKV
jgi:hypothetical protein